MFEDSCPHYVFATTSLGRFGLVFHATNCIHCRLGALRREDPTTRLVVGSVRSFPTREEAEHDRDNHNTMTPFVRAAIRTVLGSNHPRKMIGSALPSGQIQPTLDVTRLRNVIPVPPLFLGNAPSLPTRGQPILTPVFPRSGPFASSLPQAGERPLRNPALHVPRRSPKLDVYPSPVRPFRWG